MRSHETDSCAHRRGYDGKDPDHIAKQIFTEMDCKGVVADGLFGG